MKIIDLTSGNRAVWFNKQHPMALYIDRRPEVDPDMVADSRDLHELADGQFDLVVFDPPHMNCGPNSNMSKTYGYHTTKQIIELLTLGSQEAHRISKPNALMAFKWNDHDISLQKAMRLLIGWEPLFGHLTKDGPGSHSYWVMLRRA